MRKLILKLAKKARLRFSRYHTWLLRSSFGGMGKGVRIDFPIRIEHPELITVGDDCVFYSRSWINPVGEWAGQKHGGKITLGNRVMIGYSTQISSASSIVIEDDATIAAGAVIMDHMHDHRVIEASTFSAPISKPEPIRIGKKAFLGAYCFIGPGVQIGEHAVIAANAVVNKDVPAYCVAVGSPARIIRFHDESAPAAVQTAVAEGALHG